MRQSRLIVAASVLASISAACAGPPGKSGGGGGVVLKLVVPEYLGKATSVVAERFARRVDALSNGSIRVTITNWPTTLSPATPTRRMEASAIGSVRSNASQLGIIPTYAFQGQGVTTFEALDAPFLVKSYAGATRVTTGPVADLLQTGLPRLSLTGLGLVPEGMQRPFGYLKPLEGPGDFAGLTIRTPFSRAAYALLRALGARPVDMNSEGLDSAVYSGFVSGAGSLPTARDQFPQGAFTVGNLPLFPKVDVVVANSAAFARLSASQQALLRRAAAGTRSETIAVTNERTAGIEVCKAGGTLVTASPSALRALRSRAALLLASMRRDAATRTLIARIERLGADHEASLSPCSPTTVGQNGIRLDVVTGADVARLQLLRGSYRRIFTVAQLRAAGASPTDSETNQGLATLTFAGEGTPLFFALSWAGPAERPACRGRAALVSGFVRLLWNPATRCGGTIAFSWRQSGHDLVLVAFDPRTRPAWVAKAYHGTWTHVDCTPDCGGREKLTASEVQFLLKRGRPRWARSVGCTQAENDAWDYECFYSHHRNGKGVRVTFGVDVNDRTITRTSRPQQTGQPR